MFKNIAPIIALTASFTLAAPPAGTIQSMIGTTEQNSAKAPGWKPARIGARLFIKDQVRTDAESSAELRWANGGVLRLAEQSTMIVTDQPTSENSTDPGTKLLKGRLWANMQKITNTGKKFSVESPTACAGIRGTVFRVDVGTDSSTDVLVYEGKVAVGPGAVLQNEHGDSSGRHEVQGPGEVEGPKEVTLSEWVTIVAGQQIRVERSGTFKTWTFDRKNDSLDAWVKRNLELDATLNKK